MIVIVKDRLECRVIMRGNVNVNRILWEPDVINVGKVYTIFHFVKVKIIKHFQITFCPKLYNFLYITNYRM